MITLPKTEARWYETVKGHWFSVPAHVDNRPNAAIISCPECGGVFCIGHVHNINGEGRVTPSVVCPFTPCPFHQYVILEGW